MLLTITKAALALLRIAVQPRSHQNKPPAEGLKAGSTGGLMYFESVRSGVVAGEPLSGANITQKQINLFLEEIAALRQLRG
jgi:hypothetical protein